MYQETLERCWGIFHLPTHSIDEMQLATWCRGCLLFVRNFPRPERTRHTPMPKTVLFA